MASTLFIVLIILVNGLQSNQFDLYNTDDVIKRESSLDLEQNPESTDIIIKLQPDGTEEDIQDILSRYPKFKLSKQFELFGETYYKFSLDESKISKQLVDGTIGLNEDDNDILHMTNEKKNGVMRYTHRIEEAWALGYTGKGITVGVIDTLMQTNHIDLTNMDRRLYSYNSIDNRTGQTIQWVTRLGQTTLRILRKGQTTQHTDCGFLNFIAEYETSHGTTVAGVIGATKENNYCAVGVAYNTTLVAIGLLGSITPVPISDSQLARSLSHMYDTIDIYCNSYGSKGHYNYSVLGPMRRTAFENSARYNTCNVNLW
ncbi:PCSK2 [Mytilus edulis]|uniref:PCSK2 n=1 Tax=Mytilus edulis TaxID=6550 RepID=A0A8S3UDE4_MYTED|nr:PCSK2 [Mytilus edulis]